MNDAKRMDIISLLGPLRRYARALTRDETQADDLVQDALVRAYEGRASFRSSGNMRGWLLSILHNTFIDDRRRYAAETRRAEHITAIIETATPAEQESRVRLQQVQAAFRSLPDEQRTALHLVAIEGLSYQEAAAALGVPVGNPDGPALAALELPCVLSRTAAAGRSPLRTKLGPLCAL